jgi:hypothetical protein
MAHLGFKEILQFEIMGYKHDLISTIQDSEKWPSFDRPGFLLELNTLASEACEKGTLEGYLAALLIYHQLCEEMARLLLRDSQFFVQLAVFPAEINFPEKPKLMFGPLIDDLETIISFKGKDEFIAKCKEINRIRIIFVHGLTKRTSLADIRDSLANIQRLYDEIYNLFYQAHDYFKLGFKDFKKDIDWEDYLTEAQE